MRRKTLAVILSVSALGMTAAPVATAAITVGPGKGNPQTNPTGKCPPGQNSTTSPGGLKKCS